MIVYLAGGINGLSDADATDWRTYVKANIGIRHETLDPMRRDYRGREDDNVHSIVNGDLLDIEGSDVMIASCVRPSWGTAMEIYHAFTVQEIPVIAVVPSGPVSPWLRYFTTVVVASFDEAIAYVEGPLAPTYDEITA